MSSFYPVDASTTLGPAAGTPRIRDVASVSAGRPAAVGEGSLSPGSGSGTNGDREGLSRRMSPGYTGSVGHPGHATSTTFPDYGCYGQSSRAVGSGTTGGIGMTGSLSDYHRSVTAAQQQQQHQNSHQPQQQPQQSSQQQQAASGSSQTIQHPHHPHNNNYVYHPSHHYHHPDTGLGPPGVLHETTSLQAISSPTSSGATPNFADMASSSVNCCQSPHSVSSTSILDSRLTSQAALTGVSMTPMFPWMAIVGRYMYIWLGQSAYLSHFSVYWVEVLFCGDGEGLGLGTLKCQMWV